MENMEKTTAEHTTAAAWSVLRVALLDALNALDASLSVPAAISKPSFPDPAAVLCTTRWMPPIKAIAKCACSILCVAKY